MPNRSQRHKQDSHGKPPTPPEVEPTGPVLHAIDPENATNTATREEMPPPFQLHCVGENFTNKSVIVFNGEDRATQLLPDGSLRCSGELPAGEGVWTVPVYVRNKDGQASNELTFTLYGM